MELRLVVAVEVAHQLRALEPLVQERLDHEVRRAQQPIGQGVLLLLQAQDVRVVGMLVVGRQRHPEALALVANGLVGKARVRVGALQNGGDAKPARGLQRFARAHRPRVDDVDLIRHARQRARHETIMELESPHPAQSLVWDPQLAARQRGPHAHAGWQRPLHGARQHEHVRAGLGRTRGLVPGGRADACRADLVRETLKDANRGRSETHDPRAPRKPITSPGAGAGSSASSPLRCLGAGSPRRWPNQTSSASVSSPYA